MFELITLNDQITLTADQLCKNYLQHLEQAIHKKYTGQALKHVGFCIKVLEIVTQRGHLHEGDAIFEITVQVLTLRLVNDELHYGVIVEQSNTGVIVQFLGFKVSINRLLDARMSEEGWKCHYGGMEFYYDVGEQVRFKIDHVQWLDEYMIIGRMDEPGLGGIRWWK